MISERFESSPNIPVESLRLADVSPANPDRLAGAVMYALDVCNSIRQINEVPAEIVSLDIYCTPDGRVSAIGVGYKSNGQMRKQAFKEREFYSLA
jgi:hypothetical protein